MPLDNIDQALARAETALGRIDRALATRRHSAEREARLRARVGEVVEELDALIRSAPVEGVR